MASQKRQELAKTRGNLENQEKSILEKKGKGHRAISKNYTQLPGGGKSTWQGCQGSQQKGKCWEREGLITIHKFSNINNSNEVRFGGME